MRVPKTAWMKVCGSAASSSGLREVYSAADPVMDVANSQNLDRHHRALDPLVTLLLTGRLDSVRWLSRCVRFSANRIEIRTKDFLKHPWCEKWARA